MEHIVKKVCSDLCEDTNVNYFEDFIENDIKKSFQERHVDKYYDGVYYLFIEKNYKKAIELFLESNTSESLFMLGFYYLIIDKEKQYDLSLKYLLYAWFDHKNINALNYIGCYYEDAEKNNAYAEKYYKLSVEHNCQSGLSNLALFYSKNKKYDLAEECYLKLLDYKNNIDFTYCAVGDFYATYKNDYDKAFYYYNKSADICLLYESVIDLLINNISEKNNIIITYYLVKMSKSSNIDVIMEYVNLLISNKFYDIALDKLKKYNTPESNYLTAIVHLNNKESLKAFEILKNVLKMNISETLFDKIINILLTYFGDIFDEIFLFFINNYPDNSLFIKRCHIIVKKYRFSYTDGICIFCKKEKKTILLSCCHSTCITCGINNDYNNCVECQNISNDVRNNLLNMDSDFNMLLNSIYLFDFKSVSFDPKNIPELLPTISDVSFEVVNPVSQKDYVELEDIYPNSDTDNDAELN